MRTQNEIDVFGEPESVARRVFQLAAELQDWPTILPHYWRMEVRERSERHKVADFGAYRSFVSRPLAVGFPCRWRARQELFPEEGRITFRHIGGITKGMWVEWRIEPRDDHVHVTIDHALSYPVPLLGPLFAEFVVGRIFIHHIAGRTLRCFKEKVEQEHGR
jgi:ribosome-associated toxin RatA of RatAB toxin-antitoxin module